MRSEWDEMKRSDDHQLDSVVNHLKEHFSGGLTDIVRPAAARRVPRPVKSRRILDVRGVYAALFLFTPCVAERCRPRWTGRANLR